MKWKKKKKNNSKTKNWLKSHWVWSGQQASYLRCSACKPFRFNHLQLETLQVKKKEEKTADTYFLILAQAAESKTGTKQTSHKKEKKSRGRKPQKAKGKKRCACIRVCVCVRVWNLVYVQIFLCQRSIRALNSKNATKLFEQRKKMKIK